MINNQTKLLDNVLEIISVNYKCNKDKKSFVKIANYCLNLNDGFNLLFLKDKNIFLNHFFESNLNIDNFNDNIENLLINNNNNDFLILVTHGNYDIDFASLQNSFININCTLLINLINGGSYLLIFDLKNKNKIFELYDNISPIHEWFEFIFQNDSKNIILKNMGIPIYMIIYNSLFFVKNSIKQLKKFSKNIHIIDNNSTYNKLLEYYDNEYEFFLHKKNKNYGYKVYLDNNEIYWQLPRIFALTDPDLIFNCDLPNNFLEELTLLTYEFKIWKVGFALDISDESLFFDQHNYHNGKSIVNWEKQFWNIKINHNKYDIYKANIDTTFAVYNKLFKNNNDKTALRIANNYTCKHIPWYKDWHKKLDPIEFNFYKHNNNSSTILRMMNLNNIV